MDARATVSQGIQRMFGDLCGGISAASLATNATSSSGGNETLFYNNNFETNFKNSEFKKDGVSNNYQKDISKIDPNIGNVFQQLDQAVSAYESKINASNSSKKSFTDAAKNYTAQEAVSNLGLNEIKKASQNLKQIDGVINTYNSKIYQGKKDLSEYELSKVMLESKTKSTDERTKQIDEEIKKVSEKSNKADVLSQQVDAEKPRYTQAINTMKQAQEGIQTSSSQIQSINSEIQNLVIQQSSASSSTNNATETSTKGTTQPPTNTNSNNASISAKIDSLVSQRKIEEVKIEKNQKDIEDSDKVVSKFEAIQGEHEGALKAKNTVESLINEKDGLASQLNQYRGKMQNYESRKNEIKAELEKSTVAIERLNIDRELVQTKVNITSELYKDSFAKTEKQKIILEKHESVAKKDQDGIGNAESALTSKLSLFSNIQEQSKSRKPNMNA